jgi:hypothetical protein
MIQQIKEIRTMKKFSEYKNTEEQQQQQSIDEKAQWRSSFESKKELAKMAKGLVKEINAISIPDPSDSSFGGDSKKYAQAEHQMMIELAKVKMGIEGAVKHLGVIKAIGKFK